jgi:general secretion pathway protein I
MGGLASMFGAGGGKDSKGGPQQGANPMAGAAMGMAQPMFSQMVQQITQTVREVRLTVYWRDGTEVESLDIVTHVVSLGPGSDRNGGFNANPGSQPGATANQWWNPARNRLVMNPIPGPNGQMLDPETREPVVNRQEFLNSGGGRSPR